VNQQNYVARVPHFEDCLKVQEAQKAQKVKTR